MKEIFHTLPLKANVSDLQDLEMSFNDKIFEINRKMVSFALKEDVSKRFNIMSRRIREIIEVMNKNIGQDDDGMLTKKNLG